MAKDSLTCSELVRLNDACIRVRSGLPGHGPYLVGSASEGGDYRDVDVRQIVDDDEWDALFWGKPDFWGLLCLAISTYLTSVSGLPVDFQIQRMTEANEKFDKPRNPLGRVDRLFAGGGDATNWYSRDEHTCSSECADNGCQVHAAKVAAWDAEEASGGDDGAT